MIIKHIALGHDCVQKFDTATFPIEKLNITLRGSRYVIVVDPSTSSSGIIIGDTSTRKPVHMFALVRNKSKSEDYVEYNRLTDQLVRMWIESNPGKIVDMKIEQTKKTKYQRPENYAKQTAVYHLYLALARQFGMTTFIVSATKWRSYFLADYKESMNLNLTRANKKEVHLVAQSEFFELEGMPDDTTDAYGMFKHYLAVDYRQDGKLLATGDNTREYNHKIIYVITSQEYVGSYIQSYLDQLTPRFPTAEKREFVYNPNLSAEDNIRCFTSITGNMQHNVYVSPIYPSISNMPEIIKHRNNIGKISDSTPLYLVGFRLR